MSRPQRLDPDQVQCPACLAQPGDVCLEPSGRRARAIHAKRRRAADRGEITVETPDEKQTPPRNPKGPPPEARARGAANSAAARTRRRKEAEARAEELRAAAEAQALEDEAQRLAEDATRYARDRALLRRKTLEAADVAYDRLLEGLRGLQRVELDEENRPKTTPLETTDQHGRPTVKHVPDLRGAYPASTVERLAKVAASALTSLRLEEGKATGITESRTGSTADTLGDVGVEDLLRFAAENLDRQ